MGIIVAILDLELKYSELQNDLNKLTSDRKKLLLIFEFFQVVLSSNDLKLKEVYIVEIFPKYLAFIKLIKIRGLNPKTLSALIDQFKKLYGIDPTESSFFHYQDESPGTDKKGGLF